MTQATDSQRRAAKLIRILAIDGGGVRGIIPAQILVALERKLREITGEANAHVADFFDLIGGTSTGGLLTCLLLTPDRESRRPRYSAAEALDLYVQHGGEIFSSSLYHRLRTAGGLAAEKYPSDALEKVLAAYFQDDWMSDLLKPCMVPAYDIRRRRAMFFTQHDALKRPPRDFRVRDVVRAATAAPTYFEAANIESRSGVHYPCIDGAVFANNPTLCAYAEARTHFGAKAQDLAILSLGTGEEAQSYHHEVAKDWGAFAWVKPLIDIMMSGVAETVDYECRLAYEAVGVPQQYLRINMPLRDLPPGSTANLDDASEANLNALREMGMELAERMDAELSRFAELLVATDQRKGTTEYESTRAQSNLATLTSGPSPDGVDSPEARGGS